MTKVSFSWNRPSWTISSLTKNPRRLRSRRYPTLCKACCPRNALLIPPSRCKRRRVSPWTVTVFEPVGSAFMKSWIRSICPHLLPRAHPTKTTPWDNESTLPSMSFIVDDAHSVSDLMVHIHLYRAHDACITLSRHSYPVKR